MYEAKNDYEMIRVGTLKTSSWDFDKWREAVIARGKELFIEQEGMPPSIHIAYPEDGEIAFGILDISGAVDSSKSKEVLGEWLPKYLDGMNAIGAILCTEAWTFKVPMPDEGVGHGDAEELMRYALDARKEENRSESLIFTMETPLCCSMAMFDIERGPGGVRLGERRDQDGDMMGALAPMFDRSKTANA